MPRRGPLGFSMSHYRDLADGWATNRGGGPAVRGYDAWVAHVKAVAIERGWLVRGGPYEQRAYWTTAAALSGDMYGSPWGSSVPLAFGATHARIVQHAMPSLATVEAQVLAGRVILIRKSGSYDAPAGTWDYATFRNGYETLTFSEGSAAEAVDLCAWWEGDPLTGQAMMNNPYAMTSPVPYTAPGWTG